jgi:hypothetical protein
MRVVFRMIALSDVDNCNFLPENEEPSCDHRVQIQQESLDKYKCATFQFQ